MGMDVPILIEITMGLLSITLLSIIVIVITSSKKEQRIEYTGSIAGQAATEEGIAETGRRIGGGAGGIVSRGPSESYTDLVDEESSVLPSYSASPREPLDAVRSRVLLSLIKRQAIPLEELEQTVKADKEYIVQVLRELERQGLARVEGGVVHISERGERIITKLREKYAEKENWYETL